MFKFNKQHFNINVYDNWIRCFVVIGKVFAFLTLLNSFQWFAFAQCDDCNIPTNGLVAWYKAEGNSNDSVGTRHATPQPNETAHYSAGKVGQSFRFLFDDRNPLLADAAGLPTGDRTMDMWVFIDQPGDWATFLAGYGVLNDWHYGDAFYMGLTFQESHLFVATTTDFYAIYYPIQGGFDPIIGASSPTVFPVGEWHHITTTLQGNFVKLYIDGELVSSGALLSLPQNPVNAQLLIGRALEPYLALGTTPDSRVDELKIYDRALSQSEIQSIYNAGLAAPESAPTATGSNVPIQTTNATLTFDSVTAPGVTTVAPIADPAQAGNIPGGFAVSETLAFEINTTASFSGPVTSCFNVPTVSNEPDFLNLRVLHREFNAGTNQFELVDRTSSHDFPNRKICATTTSFSPFYLAKVSNKVNALFDQNQQHNSGSTIPIELQMLNPNNQNISSADLDLRARSLRNLDTGATLPAQSPGNSNPDNTFRYASGNYKYNLKTTGLPPGRYVFSFYAGTDDSYFYIVEFRVR